MGMPLRTMTEPGVGATAFRSEMMVRVGTVGTGSTMVSGKEEDSVAVGFAVGGAIAAFCVSDARTWRAARPKAKRR